MVQWFNISKRSILKKKYIAALSKPYIENASGQEAVEKNVVADKNQQRRVLTMCLMKNPQTLKHLENPTVKATTGTFYLRN